MQYISWHPLRLTEHEQVERPSCIVQYLLREKKFLVIMNYGVVIKTGYM